jgi:hypothetical protein
MEINGENYKVLHSTKYIDPVNVAATHQRYILLERLKV